MNDEIKKIDPDGLFAFLLKRGILKFLEEVGGVHYSYAFILLNFQQIGVISD